jgi:Tfp pilus assembly protein PilF
VRLADVYRQMGDYPAAKYELGEAIRVRPDYMAARVALGVLQLVSGQRPQAIKEWEAVLSQDPQNKSAQMYLRMALDPPVKSERPPESE